MIISQPEISKKNGEVWVSAQVVFQKSNLDIPSRLWFSFPEKYEHFITGHSDSFIISLFYLGMAFDEDIMVYGTVSPRLAYGLEECQQVYKTWYPHVFRPVSINYDQLAPASPEETGTGVALPFSGGVDSTFTLFQHLPHQQVLPQYRVTHCIFIHGFDIPLNNAYEYQRIANNFSAALDPLHVELVECKTNLHYFMTGKLNWSHAHSGGMIGTTLILSRLVKYILVSSSWSLHKFEPWGSSVMTDPMLSTEQIETIYYGFPYSRMEKVEAISQWEPAYKFLRVCLNPKKDKDADNCCHCEKCLRTMIFLEAIDSLENFQTFTRPIGLLDYFRWIPGFIIHIPEVVPYLIQRKKYYIISLLIIPQIIVWIQHILRKCLPYSFKRWIKNKTYNAGKDAYNICNLPNDMEN